DSEGDGGHAMDVDAGRDRLLAIVHHGAREIAEPDTVQICVDEEDGAAARDAAHDPGRRKGLAEQLDWAVLDRVPGEEAGYGADRAAKLIAGNRSFTGAERDG